MFMEKWVILATVLVLVIGMSGCVSYLPDRGTVEEQYCVAPGGESMTISEAMEIALASECVENGTLKETSVCNADTGTWWIDLDIEKEGCNPACVVDIVEGTSEINWRCTGLIP